MGLSPNVALMLLTSLVTVVKLGIKIVNLLLPKTELESKLFRFFIREKYSAHDT